MADLGARIAFADPLSGRELAAFVMAVETGSVQGAADALALTQSAATKRLLALERRLGVSLLDRGSRGVTPTAEGRLLYPVAREALDALQRAEAVVRSQAMSPLLRVQSSRTIGETLLGQWLAAFRVVAADQRVAAEVTNSELVVRAVREGVAEVGFIEGPPAAMRGLRDLIVARDELVVVVATGHRWARRRAVSSRMLNGESWMTREAGSGTRAVVEARLAHAGVRLTPSLEVSSTEGLKRAVQSEGFTLLSRRTISSELAAGTLAAVPVSDVDLTRAFRAIRRTRPGLQGPARQFWRWLETTIAPHAGRDDRVSE